MTYLFFSGRLGPCSTARAKEQCEMSIVFLQGGGLSKEQMDRVRLERHQLWLFFRLITDVLCLRKRRNSDGETKQ